jgi:phage-related protein
LQLFVVRPAFLSVMSPDFPDAVFLLDNISKMTYNVAMNTDDKPLVWLSGEVRTPPFSKAARIEAGFLLRALQKGERLSLPHSRPMPLIGARCHELRINDRDLTWRIIYRVDKDAIVILDVFPKKSLKTPQKVIEACKRRIVDYDS